MATRIGDFLNDFMDAFERRGKAIRYKGRLVVKDYCEEAPHWVEIRFTPLTGPSILFQITADNAARLTIQSTRRKDRGTTLLSIGSLVLRPRAEAIVATFERTISLSKKAESGLKSIRDCWAEISVAPM